MPRDDWAKANSRAMFGQAPQKRLFKKASERRTTKAARKANAAMRRDPAIVASRASFNTTLWFGAHQGKTLHEVPEDYLRWIATQTWRDFRVQGLAMFLRDRLGLDPPANESQRRADTPPTRQDASHAAC